jgi:rubrerythrin
MSEETAMAVEALRQAMLNEKETREFYLEAVDRAVDDEARRMFEELAEEEAKHMKIVQDQHDSLKAGQGWTVAADFEDLGEVDITPLEFKRAEMRDKIGDSTTPLEALTIAAEMENNSFKFYVEQLEATEDPQGRTIYGYLVKAERNHFNTVMSNWEYQVNVGQR